MRLVVDCRYVTPGRHNGISRYTAGLVHALADLHPLTMLISDERQLAHLPAAPWVRVSAPTSLREPLVARQVNRLAPDVVFSPMQTMGTWGRRYQVLLTLGQLPFDPATKTFHFDSPAGVEAMQLHVETPVKMGITTELNTDCSTAALSGKAAVTLANGTPSLSINAALGYHYEMAGTPKINGKTPVAGGTADGWGFVTPGKAPHPNLATAFLRMMATEAAQYQWALIYGGSLSAWKNIAVNDTSQYSPRNDTNPTYKLRKQFSTILGSVKFIGQVGYLSKVSDAIIAASQSVRQGKMNSQAAAKRIQSLAEAQYKQYQIDLQNLQ